jgi:hypothetical protein
MTDGTGSPRDEHLVPGRGTQPCAQLLERLARSSWAGAVVLEVSTRRARNREQREVDLTEALAFTRLNLAAVAELDALDLDADRAELDAADLAGPEASDGDGLATLRRGSAR